jgi:hypothetical protein
VTTLAAPPAGGWTDEYKTTKLVLRVIEAGSYKMNGSYYVTISQPFYMGVFEVTQKQYALVEGYNPANYTYRGDARPVEDVSWSMIRGNSSRHNWPSVTTVDADSFMGKLRAKTGLSLDLPTEAQWEYACRAGTTTLYSTGDNELSDRVKYHLDNLPNAWGFYYMGTAKSCEACIGFLEIHYGTKHVIDPLGPTYMEAKGIWPTKGGVGDYGSNRRMGWDWDDDASHWNATFRVALWCDRD